jgi:ligand-binding sensor domain-containing protein
MSIQTFGQDTRSISLRKITQDDGLSSYYITKIIQTSNGFLWVGTQDGLNCYDGMTFRLYNAQADDKYRIGSNFISDLFEDKKRNILWVASSYGGVTGIDLTTLSVVKRITDNPSGKKLSENWIRAIAVQNDILWIGISGGIFAYNISDGKYLSLSSSDLDLKSLNVARVLPSNQNKVYFLCDDFGLISITTGKLEVNVVFSLNELNLTNNKSKLRFWNVINDNNKIYLATSWGLRILEYSSNTLKILDQYTAPEIFDKEVFSCAMDNDKKLWLSTANHFYSYNTNTHRLENFKEEKRDIEDWFSFVYQVYCGNNNIIWIGTQEGLASFNSNRTPFTAYFSSSFSDTKIKHAFALLPYSDSIVYCGDENGVYHVNLRTRRIEKIDPSGSNYMIFRSKKNEIFVSGGDGLRLINGVKISPANLKYPELAHLNFDLLHSGIQYNDSLIIFGSVLQKGLHVWNTVQRILTTYHKDSVKNKIKDLSVISNLYKNKNGELFIVTDQSIIKFDPVTKKHTLFEIRSSDVKFSNFMDMCETDKGYWIATYGNGIIETDKNFNFKTLINSKKGLSNDGVYKIFFEDSLILATTNNGLSVINNFTYKTKSYFQSDGLHSSSFEQVCGFQTPHRIYAGGVNGFTVINPEEFSFNTVPPSIYFSNIRIKTKYNSIDTTNLFIKSIKIPSDALQATLYFSTLNYSDPKRSEIAYKINEREADWIDLGNTNSLPLIGFAPGTYHLQIKAANEDGVWSQPKELTLIFLPKWYQTWWFKF